MIGRHVLFNLLGALAPPVVAVFVIPPYLHAIGAERFGVLALIWLVFGYFGLFDFGLSRATAHSLAKLDDRSSAAFSDTVWTAIAMNAVLGAIGGLAFLAASPLIIARFGTTDPRLSAEIARSLPWIAALVPLATVGGVFTGILEATRRFLAINVLQVAGTVLFQPLPLLAILVAGPDVETAVIATTLARLVTVAASAAVAMNTGPVRRAIRIDPAIGKALLRYGGWVSVTNVVSPLLVSVDQILIGALLGASAVAFYSVPFSFAMKAQILPGAVTRALFPRLSGLRPAEAFALSRKATKTVGLLLAAGIGPAILVSQLILTVWIGPDFAAQAGPTTRILFLAAWINGIAYIPVATLQSQGRPDIVAKFHAVEIGPFLGLLWVAMHLFGLPGAAWAWFARATADAILLFHASGYRWRDYAPVAPALLVVACSYALSEFWSVGAPAAFGTATLVGLAVLAFTVFDDETVRLWVAGVRGARLRAAAQKAG